MKKLICGVYKITNPISQIYIGSSTDVERRFHQYKTLQTKKQPKINKSLIDFLPENHTYEVLIECDSRKLLEMERYYILLFASMDNGLNMKMPSEWNNHIETEEPEEQLDYFIHATKNLSQIKTTSLLSAAQMTGQSYEAMRYLKFPFELNQWKFTKINKAI